MPLIRLPPSQTDERTVVEAIRSLLPAEHWAVLLGVGDDAAVLRPQTLPWVITCDSLVEGVHYRPEWSDAATIGFKLAHVNMSDLAAMGAWPAVAFLSVVAPLEGAANYLLDIHQALQVELSKVGATLAGGNFSTSPVGSSFSLTLLGLSDWPVLTRSGARIGDKVYVTGHIGDSGAGLRLLLRGLGQPMDSNDCIVRHLRPQSRLHLSRYLTQYISPTACIDVSDGLAKDGEQIADASNVSLQISLERIPLSRSYCEAMGPFVYPAIAAQAVGLGEDYELLFTVPADTAVPLQIDGIPITHIGEVLPRQEQSVVWLYNGQPTSGETRGWDHFKVSTVPSRFRESAEIDK
ncbi:MAG: thiamine-phosphate kinase [Myxococcales bacterium]|nr:thiamine-phosphate kinase [Myxococcales bacterium]